MHSIPYRNRHRPAAIQATRHGDDSGIVHARRKPPTNNRDDMFLIDRRRNTVSHRKLVLYRLAAAPRPAATGPAAPRSAASVPHQRLPAGRRLALSVYQTSSPRSATRRTGSLITELLFALGIVAILTAGIVPGILMTRQAEATSADHAAALLELNSVLDRFSALPFEQITPEAAKGIQASKSFANRLTGVVLSVTVSDVEESTGNNGRITGRRILARAEWPGRNEIRHSRSLATWVFSEGRRR